MTAEAAIAIERSGDSTAAAALVQLEPAVTAARLFGMVEHHRRLIAAGTQAGGDQG